MRRLALLLACATLALSAQEAAIGVRAHALAPMGDLRDLTDGQPGLGLAAFVNIPLSRGLVLRPLVGGQFIPKGDTLGLAGTKTSVASTDLLVDGLWYPNEDPERGPYLIFSTGLQQWRLRASGATPGTTSATRLGVQGGLGWQITPRIGLELRGFWSPVSSTVTASGVMAGATLKF